MAGWFAAVEDAPAGSVRETPRRTVVRYRTAGVFCVYAAFGWRSSAWGSGFGADGLAGFVVRSLGSVVPAEIRREVHRSPWVGVTFEASPDNAGGGVPPLRR